MQTNNTNTTPEFTIRQATVADVKALARHRCEMFKDMSQLRKQELPEDTYHALAEASIAYFNKAIPIGEYLAWVVAPQSHPELIVAGGGMQLRHILPRPDRTGRLQKP